jgi:hypothetical protein
VSSLAGKLAFLVIPTFYKNELGYFKAQKKVLDSNHEPFNVHSQIIQIGQGW